MNSDWWNARSVALRELVREVPVEEFRHGDQRDRPLFLQPEPRDLALGVPGEGRGARFRSVGDGSWVGLDGYYAGEPLRVVRDEAGSVSHLDLASFRYTRLPYDPERDIPGGVDDAGWR